jgi:hypothetical protein
MERESTVDVGNPWRGRRLRKGLESEAGNFLCFILKGARVKLLEREKKFIVHIARIFRLLYTLHCC